MSYKDEMRKASQQSQEFPKIDIGLRITSKAKDGKPAFLWVTKDGNGNKTETHKPVKMTAVLIGSGITMSAYSPSHPPNGGSYRTTVYFTRNDIVTLFSPEGKREFVGTPAQVEEYLGKKGSGKDKIDTPKKQMVLYLVTDKGVMVEMRTNTTIAISQLKNIGSKNLEYMVEIQPKIYDRKDFGEDVRKNLGKLADTNPPCYCDIRITSEPLTDDFAEKSNLEHFAKSFNSYKEFAMKWTGESEKKKESSPGQDGPQNTDTAFDSVSDDGASVDDDENDLPF